MRRLFGSLLGVFLISCGTAAASPSSPLPAQWSTADCSWAIQTLINGVWDDTHAARTDPAHAAYFTSAAHTHALEKQAAWMHCGKGAADFVDPTPTDQQVIGTLLQGRSTHTDAADIAYYDRLLGLFRTGKCPDTHCSFAPGTRAAADATKER